MSNPVKWLEIATNDIERAKDFYAEVFKIEFQYMEMPDSKMYMFGAPGQEGSAGTLVQGKGSTPSADGSIVYFACEDCATEAARVEKAGGTIVVPKTDIGEFGFFAQCMDTEGNRIGMHSMK